jgi:anti-sigma factor (TIGR02949 family)
MKCHDANHHLDLFMDGELSVPENLKVLEHLNLCRSCAGLYEGEKALRAVLRARVGSDAAPEGLAEKLASLATAAPAAPAVTAVTPFARRRLFSIAAAAGFFVVMTTLFFTTPGEMPRAFATELSTKHKETHEGFCGVHRDDCLCLCPRCCSDSVNPVGKFFTKRVGHDACTHDLSDLGYRPVGASVWEHRGRPICWTVQRDDEGHTITHGLVTTKIAKEPGPLLVCDGVDRPVVMMPVAGTDMTCVFVFDSESEAQRFRESRNLK